MTADEQSVAVIGGGPAGMMAAEVAASAGLKVRLYDAKRSVGRKFLVAGKSGLNVTNGQAFPEFLDNYRGGGLPIAFYDALRQFDNQSLRKWAAELGVETYVASSGKVFPVGMKAAPLLRRWVERLRGLGVDLSMGHRLVGVNKAEHGLRLEFECNGKRWEQIHGGVVMALGGGSWSMTGSDGCWVDLLESIGIGTVPLSSANCGWEVAWTEEMLASAEGFPLKNLVVRAGGGESHGELVVTRYGLEGGPIYRLGPDIRGMAEPHVEIDFKASFSVEELVRKMESVRRDFLKEAGQRWKLSAAAIALLRMLYGEMSSARELAEVVKACRVPLLRARPIDEAISSAGGVKWSEVDEFLMSRKVEGLFFAGEMLDWEAPTGGYLLQACMATGKKAGISAAAWLRRESNGNV